MVFFIFFMFTVVVVLNSGHVEGRVLNEKGSQFVEISGTDFLRDGVPLYFNGFNSYWMMVYASNPSTRGNVTSVFQEATQHGMNLARTWAFSDGGVYPLQTSPGIYNQDMFKGLDFVISEAGKYGIYLILSLVNNYPDYGGRKQYVEWAREQGQSVKSEDEFYSNPIVKNYYKNHIKAILERQNSISGVTYKDDPTILAWELINEPRCESDLSGRVLQDWIQEMAAYVKSIDNKHLLEIGLEGFYGESKKQSNPKGYLLGTDFISNNQVVEIDFTTIHAYPSAWYGFATLHIAFISLTMEKMYLFNNYYLHCRLPGSDDRAQAVFVQKWLQEHIEDSTIVLKKPILFAEFGKSSNVTAFKISERDNYFETVYSEIYASAESGGGCYGSLFWQVLGKEMDGMRDGYEVVFEESPSTAYVIAQQSHKLADLGRRKMLF
ncbi:mannan endo-1,4-beta-mannosidase [Ranunculus cassubicifolius]